MKTESKYEDLTNEGKLAYRREKRDLIDAYSKGKRKPNPFSKNVRFIELQAYDEYKTMELKNE